MTARILLITAIGLLAYMTVAWAIARQRKRLDTVDTAYGFGFFVAAIIVLAQHPSWRSLLLATLIGIWGTRLSSHIAARSAKRKEDPRYKELSDKWKGNFWARAYASVFLVQGLVIWLVSLPTMFAAGLTTDAAKWWTLIGLLVWLVGFIVEVVSDRQLGIFISDPNNKGKPMGLGLWRYSRHPNYFGEITQWTGIALIALSAQNGWAGLLGPIILATVIIFVSGIPPSEKHHIDDPDWQEYRRKTSLLVLLPPKN